MRTSLVVWVLLCIMYLKIRQFPGDNDATRDFDVINGSAMKT